MGSTSERERQRIRRSSRERTLFGLRFRTGALSLSVLWLPLEVRIHLPALPLRPLPCPAPGSSRLLRPCEPRRLRGSVQSRYCHALYVLSCPELRSLRRAVLWTLLA